MPRFEDEIECAKCAINFHVNLHEGESGECPSCGARFVIDGLGDDWSFPDWLHD